MYNAERVSNVMVGRNAESETALCKSESVYISYERTHWPQVLLVLGTFFPEEVA